MLTVSLHGIKIHAPHGLYAEEHTLGNDFEVDVDIWVQTTNTHPWPYVDYTIINSIVLHSFKQPGQLLEKFVQNIHAALKMNIAAAEKIKVAVRKLHPPLPGEVRYAQVSYEG